MTVRYLGVQPLAPRAAAVGSHHIGLRPGLIDEHEPPGVEPSLIALPARPAAGNVMPFLFGRQYAFF